MVKPLVLKKPSLKPQPVTNQRTLRPFVSLCVIFRDNIDTINKLLDSVKDHFEEYVFTDTGSVDGTRQAIAKWAKTNNQKLILNNFEWCDDFAKARQFNFKSASGIWRMFLDTDDVLVNGAYVEKACMSVPQHIHGILLSYDYDVHERLDTMRLCRWDSGFEWRDAIHERLCYTKEEDATKQPTHFARADEKQVQVWHKRKQPGDKERALFRNARIAEREFKATNDPAYKARLCRTIAMEMKMEGRFDEAVPFLEKLATEYGFIAEGRHAWSDLHRIWVMWGDLEKSLDAARKAGPSYEAITHFQRGDFEKCIEAQNRGSRFGPQVTHEGFLFEKAVAPALQAHAVMELGGKASQAERIINTIPSDLRVHDICHRDVGALRIKIDRITIVVPGTPQPFDGNTTSGMLGGSEEAALYLARALAKLGRNVRIFGVLQPHTMPGLDKDGIDWQPFESFNPLDEHGYVVYWRAPMGAHNLLAYMTETHERKAKGEEHIVTPTGFSGVGLWLHDLATGLPPDAASNIFAACNSVLVLSDSHKRSLTQGWTQEQIDKVKWFKVKNGIVKQDMVNNYDFVRDDNKVIYSSCPTRGLVHLLRAWPKIKTACPQASLDIYYSWDMTKRDEPHLYKEISEAYEAVKHLDVIHHGGVSHDVLHKALGKCNVWAYSHFEKPLVETFCISVVKAIALGATAITSKFGALPETAPDATFVDDVKDYANVVIQHLKNPVGLQKRIDLAKKYQAIYDWDEIAKEFSDIWTWKKTIPVPEPQK